MTTLIPKYDQGATSAVNRPINLKLGEVISVLDFINANDAALIVSNNTGQNATLVTQGINAAFTAAGSGVVFFPAGTYITSSSITTYGSWYGCGRGTVISPNGDFPAFVVQSAHLNGQQFGFAYGYAIDYSSAGTLTVNGSAHWLNKGATDPTNSGTSTFQFSDIYINKAYHGFYQAPADIAVLWNISFKNISILRSKDYGIYLNASGTNGSLQATFDGILIDGLEIATAMGVYLNAISKVYFNGITAGLQSNTAGCIFYASNCNIEAIIQCENNTITTANNNLIQFLNCQRVKFNGQFTTMTVNVGAGNVCNYVYFDPNNSNIIIENIWNQAPTIVSGGIKKIFINAAATTATQLKILDKTILASECNIPTAILQQTTFQEGIVKTANGAIYDSSSQASVSTATIIYPWVDNNDIGTETQSALIMVNGTNSGNANINFVDLLLVISSTNNSYGKVLTVVSSNGYGTPAARTYTQDSSGNLLCAMASGTYYIRSAALHGYSPYR